MTDLKVQNLSLLRRCFQAVIGFVYVRGFLRSYVKKTQSRIPESVRLAWEREVLIRKIKKQRYLLQWGGLHFAQITNSIVTFFLRYRVIFSLTVKIFAAAATMSLPCGFFLISRWYYPVISRFSDYQISEKITTPYFKEFLSGYQPLQQKYTPETLLPFEAMTNKHFRLIPGNKGQWLLKAGSDLVRTDIMPGALFHEGQPPITLRWSDANKPLPLSLIENENRLHLSLVALSQQTTSCKIAVSWPGSDLPQEFDLPPAPPFLPVVPQNPVVMLLRGLNPDFLNHFDYVKEINIEVDRFPSSLIVNLAAEVPQDEPSTKTPSQYSAAAPPKCLFWLKSAAIERGLLHSQKSAWSLTISDQLPDLDAASQAAKTFARTRVIYVASRGQNVEQMLLKLGGFSEMIVFSNPHYALRNALEYVFGEFSSAPWGPQRLFLYIDPRVRAPFSEFTLSELLLRLKGGHSVNNQQAARARYLKKEVKIFLNAMNSLGISNNIKINKSLTTDEKNN